MHGTTSVRRVPWADATASRLEAGVGRRSADLELRLTIAPANSKRLNISSSHTDYTESAPYAQRILVTSCFAETSGSWGLNQQPTYVMRVRVDGPGTEWQDKGPFNNGSAGAWGSSLCMHEHQASLLPAPAGATRVARVTLIATWHGPPGSAALPAHMPPPPLPAMFGSFGACIKLPTWTDHVELRAGHAGRQNHEASVSGQLEQLLGAAGQSHQDKVATGLGVGPKGSAPAMHHQAKLETGLGVVPGMNCGAARSHHAAGSWATTSRAEQQALVLRWLQEEVQGSSGKPGDKPGIAGAHRLYEQHMQTMCIKAFRAIAREVLNQPQHQQLASRFPLSEGKCDLCSVMQPWARFWGGVGPAPARFSAPSAGCDHFIVRWYHTLGHTRPHTPAKDHGTELSLPGAAEREPWAPL